MMLRNARVHTDIDEEIAITLGEIGRPTGLPWGCRIMIMVMGHILACA